MPTTRFHKRLIILCGSFLVSGLFSFKAWATLDFKEATLDNGLTIITAKVSNTPLVKMRVQFGAGAKTETKDTDGLTHLLEHLFMKGNKLTPTEVAFKKRLRELGVSSNATTYIDYVDYHFTFLSAYLDEVSELAGTIAQSLTLDPREIKEEITVVIDEYNRHMLRRYFAFWRVSMHYLLGKQHFAYSAIGTTSENIYKADQKTLRELANTIMAPANTRIFVVGDVDHQQVIKTIDSHFGNWKAPPHWQKPPTAENPPFPTTSQRFNFAHHEQTGAGGYIRFDGSQIFDQPKDIITGEILAKLLSHKSSRFHKKYIQSGKYYYAGIDENTNSYAPTYNIYIGTQESENIDQAIDDMLKETQLWTNQKDYFTQKQLDNLKQQIDISLTSASDSFTTIESILSETAASHGLGFIKYSLREIPHITLKDIATFAKNYFVDKPHVIGVLYNDKKAKELNIDLNGDAYYNKHLKQTAEYSPASKTSP
ncbi:MAG: pitrilysin family protein [Proteobacteria bacterium]|nr:pitrilysin family protein [Pseudomonadota bacterium]